MATACYRFLSGFIVIVAILFLYAVQLLDDGPMHRYESFAAIRNKSRAKWFVDGQEYMAAVADAIKSAESEILIMDWQMNPELFLKRPDSGVNNSSLQWRLDKLLQAKANENVRIYIMLYWETVAATNLGSDHTLNMFRNSSNIEVIRHPDSLNVASHPDTLPIWSHHEKMVIIDRKITFLGGIDLCFGRWDTRNHELTDDHPAHPSVISDNVESFADDEDREVRHARWVGKDYRNTFLTDDTYLNTDWAKPFQDYDRMDRTEIPRMPWHDVACAFTGDAVADAVEHFNQRYNSLKHGWYAWLWKGLKPIRFALLPSASKDESPLFKSNSHDVNIQVLRSVDHWSAGQPLERSIYNAYLDLIKHSEHFIYIENQFFISSQEGFFRKVQNQIQSALVDRIVRAKESSQDFHVMVITPLKPDFPGTLESDDWNSDAFRAITNWNQRTIYHGEDSLFSKLEKRNISRESAKKYFSVYSLRTHGLLQGSFVTEIIYVHSKLMIVDDRVTIIGSANINDRSMLGSRDSEVAVIIEDKNPTAGRMNGKPYQIGEFSRSLRMDLMKEHLGMLTSKDESEITAALGDPLDRVFLKAVEFVAEKNSAAYLIVFGPALMLGLEENYADLMLEENIAEYRDSQIRVDYPIPRKDSKEVRAIMKGIIGQLVNYPCVFSLDKLQHSPLDNINMFAHLDQKMFSGPLDNTMLA